MSIHQLQLELQLTKHKSDKAFKIWHLLYGVIYQTYFDKSNHMEKARHLSAEEGNAVKIAPSLLVATDSLTRGTASINTVELVSPDSSLQIGPLAWPRVKLR